MIEFLAVVSSSITYKVAANYVAMGLILLGVAIYLRREDKKGRS